MPTYSAYGLTISSAIDLPELALHPHEGEPDVEIATAELPGEWTGGAASRVVEAAEDSVRLMYRNGVQVLIREGRTLTVDAAGEEPGWVRQCLLGPCFALLLQQRGGLVLHGSAVQIGSRATVFVGNKGEGKSTTATALTGRGFGLLTDDVAAVEWEGGHPVVRTGFARVKLAPDATAALRIDHETLTPYHSQLPKRMLQVPLAESDRTPLGCVCVLETAEELVLEPLGARFALGALLPHLYAPRFLGPSSITPALMATAARLVADVPVLRLGRPRDLSLLDDALDLILDSAALEQAR